MPAIECKAGCGKHAYRDTGLCGSSECRWKWRFISLNTEYEKLVEQNAARSKADREATAQWARETHRLVIPEHRDLVLWLMQQVERLLNEDVRRGELILVRTDEVDKLTEEVERLRAKLEVCVDCQGKAEAGYSDKMPLCGKCWNERAIRHQLSMRAFVQFCRFVPGHSRASPRETSRQHRVGQTCTQARSWFNAAQHGTPLTRRVTEVGSRSPENATRFPRCLRTNLVPTGEGFPRFSVARRGVDVEPLTRSRVPRVGTRSATLLPVPVSTARSGRRGPSPSCSLPTECAASQDIRGPASTAAKLHSHPTVDDPLRLKVSP